MSEGLTLAKLKQAAITLGAREGAGTPTFVWYPSMRFLRRCGMSPLMIQQMLRSGQIKKPVRLIGIDYIP